jgi:hypothetical protein
VQSSTAAQIPISEFSRLKHKAISGRHASLKHNSSQFYASGSVVRRRGFQQETLPKTTAGEERCFMLASVDYVFVLDETIEDISPRYRLYRDYRRPLTGTDSHPRATVGWAAVPFSARRAASTVIKRTIDLPGCRSNTSHPTGARVHGMRNRQFSVTRQCKRKRPRP